MNEQMISVKPSKIFSGGKNNIKGEIALSLNISLSVVRLQIRFRLIF